MKEQILNFTFQIRIRSFSLDIPRNHLTNPAGIGEHPQVIEEADKLVNDISTHKGNLYEVSKILESL